MNEDEFLDCVFEGDIEAVKKVIAENDRPGVNFVCHKLNATPLIIAVDSGFPAMVELFLMNGANPDFTRPGLSLPLYHAIELAEEAADYQGTDDSGLLEIIRLLMEYGANANALNYNETSPVDYAAHRYPPALKIINNYVK
ncbi:MAG: ankyrin repeat domain-containing protein [Crocinitomicaceae bacterium]|nr:ankyrin repeat domain-containing protein [Crocinitomicaceae bacterium]NGF75470.1 ankyrin repeat domain-containing protein [Fluviicola sp. SGL-29]